MGDQTHHARGPHGGGHVMSSLGDLQNIIRDKYNIEPGALDPNLSMREQGLDSLAVAEFLFEVEDRLGLALPDEHQQIETLAGLADLIDRLRAKQAA
jgi:acyl carrier protein